MLPPNDPVDLREGQIKLLGRCGRRVDRVEAIAPPHDPVLSGRLGHENLIIRTHPSGIPLLLKHANDFEEDPSNLDRLAN